MSNMDSHGIPDVKKVVESSCRELTRRAEADSTTPADKSPVSTTPPVMAAPVMAAPTSSDEKEKEADTARLGRGHRVKKTKRRFDEEDSTGAGGREEAAKADDAAPTSSEDGKVATANKGKKASESSEEDSTGAGGREEAAKKAVANKVTTHQTQVVKMEEDIKASPNATMTDGVEDKYSEAAVREKYSTSPVLESGGSEKSGAKSRGGSNYSETPVETKGEADGQSSNAQAVTSEAGPSPSSTKVYWTRMGERVITTSGGLTLYCYNCNDWYRRGPTFDGEEDLALGDPFNYVPLGRTIHK